MDSVMSKYIESFKVITFLFILPGCGGSDGGSRNESAIKVQVNSNPTANAGNDQTVFEYILVTLSGSGSDPDGSIVSYNWSQISGTNVTLENSETFEASFNAPRVTSQSYLSFELKVTDDQGATAVDIVNIIVNIIVIPPPVTNTPPSVNAGADQTVTAKSIVQLSGVASDLEGEVTVNWLQTSGETVTLTNTTTLITAFVAPDVAVKDILIFDLTATDNAGKLATDSINIRVNPDLTFGEAPLGNWRVSQKRIDYDSNGIFEGLQVYEYDEHGRLIKVTYTYVDDGVEDTEYYISFSIGDDTIDGSAMIEYDNQSRTTRYFYEQDGDEAEFKFESIEGLKLGKVTLDVSSPTILEGSFEYNLDELVTSSLDGFGSKYEYVWSDTNKLISWKEKDGNTTISSMLLYYTSDVLTSLEYDGSDDSYTETFSYDDNGLLSQVKYGFYLVEGTVIIQNDWEKMPCYTSHIWSPSSVPELKLTPQNIPGGTELGTGWAWSDCAQVDP